MTLGLHICAHDVHICVQELTDEIIASQALNYTFIPFVEYYDCSVCYSIFPNVVVPQD